MKLLAGQVLIRRQSPRQIPIPASFQERGKGSQGERLAKCKGKGRGTRFEDLVKQHKDKFVLKRDGQEVCFKFQDGNCSDQGCVRAHVCAGCGRNAPWQQMQMLQVRLKTNFVRSTLSKNQVQAREPRERISTKVSVESDPCVPCRLPLSAQFPRGLRSLSWFSARPNQSWMNSHRRSAANSWLSGKSSLPNSCIFHPVVSSQSTPF